MLFLKEKKNTILQKHKIPSPEIMRPLICGNIQKYAYTMTTISCTCTLMTFSWWDFNIWHASTTYLTTFFFSVSSLKGILGNSSLDLTKLWHVWSNLYQPSQIWNEKGVAHGIHIDTAAKGVQLAKRANLSMTWSHYLTFAWLNFPGHHYHE